MIPGSNDLGWEIRTMSDVEKENHRMPFIFKALCTVLIAICVVIGVIGLVLPIIPGILFLFIAAFLLAKISPRFETIFKGTSALGKMRKFRRSVTALSIPQRLKLSFWVAARTLVNTVETGVRFVKKA